MVSFISMTIYPRRRTPDTHWMGLLSLRADLDAVEKRKGLLPSREWNFSSSVVQYTT
jgi:hypothetical protein